MAGKQVVELGAAGVEGCDAEDGIDGGDQTDDDRWYEDKNVGHPRDVYMRPTPDVFEDIEPVSLRDIICVQA